LTDLRGLGGPDIVFEARGEPRVGPDIESEFFRIAQEAVSNALRHAEASEVRVSVVAAGGKVTLAVDDDGTGLPKRRVRRGVGGVGLDAMRERAELIGATLDVRDRPTGGTQVRLEYIVEGTE